MPEWAVPAGRLGTAARLTPPSRGAKSAAMNPFQKFLAAVLPSYSTRVHWKRRFHSIDYKFVAAAIALAVLLGLAIRYL